MSNTKISNLTTAAALTGSEVAPIVQSSNTVKVTTQSIANLNYTQLSYNLNIVYSGVGTVTATTLKNTTGQTYTVSIEVGPSGISNVLRITASSSVFTNNKTYISAGNFLFVPVPIIKQIVYPICYWVSSTIIEIAFYSYDGSEYDFAGSPVSSSYPSPVNILIFS